MKNSNIAQFSLLASLALIFGYIESMFPAFIPIPGIKLGLSNIVVLFALYRMNKKSTFFIIIVKVFVSSLLFSGMNTLLYSLCGGLLSLWGMSLFKEKFSITGTGMLGAILHNTGQLFAAAAVMKSTYVFFWYPPLILSGLLFGFVTGRICTIAVKHIERL